MTKHAKIYMKHFGHGEQDIIFCEACKRQAVDIHHIKYKSRGGKDEIGNLMALCRRCHDKAHNEVFKESEMQYIHNCFMTGQRQQFVK